MTQTQDPENIAATNAPAKAHGDGADRRIALLRFGGEVTLKAPATRRRFTKRLLKNLKDAVKSEGIVARIERDHDRVYVETDSPGDLEQLSHCFGLQSISLVERRDWATLEDLVSSAIELYAETVRGKTFAVRARRVGERREIPVRSQEVARAVGTALGEYAAGVNLDNPDVEVHLEIMPESVFFFSHKIPGPGGLPVGVEGHAISLVSGGFDSAVSSWLMMKRGVALDYVFCNMGGREHQLGVLRVMKQISDKWSYGLRPRLHSIDFDLVTRNIREHGETRYWQVLLKRLMLRAGAMVAEERNACALITGDAVGQVSSQTLQNIAVISQATNVPVLRPLIGFNKDEIIAIARRIGTESLSKNVDEYCAMVPTKPATNADLKVVLREEALLDATLLEQAVAERSVIDLRSLDLDAAEGGDLETQAIKDGAIVLDLRSAAAYRGWHYPDALHLEFNAALRAFEQFDKEQDYVLVCEFGLKSAHLAELMRKEGMRATHFGKGLRDLIAYADANGFATPDGW
ncbi:MAG: thiamine biosynthesis protein ThiI [Myxococcota bacterium]|jgi:thiamine biosynthesis protein ThiI